MSTAEVSVQKSLETVALNHHLLLSLFLNLFIYLFIFGCIGSSLLHVGFL